MDRYYLTNEDDSLVPSTRVLRTVNRSLREQVERLRHTTDEFFLAICETNKSAELAMGELWGSGEFDCGPQDYDFIVTRCLAAIREYNEQHPA